jgi:hypothetical protein
MARRILRLDAGVASVAREAQFDSEAQLHSAIAEHPEVLPSEDIGVGPLVAVANELDVGAGPIDLLATDALGRLVIVEFKRGTENPDVRKVVAQVLEYGSSLWRLPYEELEQRCRTCAPGFPDTLAEHVEDGLRRIDESLDHDTFRAGVVRCLHDGSFVFLYVGRDLDERTRRVMTYLSDGARMTFFAVEIDHFHAGDAHTSVLVPRTAFVPSWVTAPGGIEGGGSGRTLDAAPAETRELVQRMDALAEELGLVARSRPTGKQYLPRLLEPGANASSGVGLFASQRGMEINLNVFHAYGEHDIAERLKAAFGAVMGVAFRNAKDWPSQSCAKVLPRWERLRSEVLVPYFEARAAHAAKTPIEASPLSAATTPAEEQPQGSEARLL